jgi:hypothetical protein
MVDGLVREVGKSERRILKRRCVGGQPPSIEWRMVDKSGEDGIRTTLDLGT